ncbi:MAG: anhydro-N-acetylmuramic acid kinase [Flavobacteriaceae bacterium]|nr:MAG: anhydro-N-acetylmuramic acid kinase [Flavobacteriaceae bacterium]
MASKKANKTYGLGLMSGTSLDGLDIVYVCFKENNAKTDFKIIHGKTYPYSTKWTKNLKEAPFISGRELIELDQKYSRYLAEKCKDFIEEYQIKKLDFIASHGHTLFHQPEKGYTFQLGNKPILSTLTKKIVVCDFRVQDVDFDGQGAPLVPIGDKLLFSKYDGCVNLGGFSNLSFSKNKKTIAFDICPVNFVLNRLCQSLEKKYDKGGKIAKNGILIPKLLDELNQIEYYHLTPPKSLGQEWVEQNIYPLFEQYPEKPENLIATFTEHAAMQIARELENNGLMKVLFTGGGAFNDFLLQRISVHFPKTKIVVPQKEIVEFKEALIFAFLGLRKLQGKNNTLASVTGAKKNHSAGTIFFP